MSGLVLKNSPDCKTKGIHCKRMILDPPRLPASENERARSMAGSLYSIPNRLFLLRSLLAGNGSLKPGAGSKSRHRGRCDLELLARLRVAAHARGTLR